MGNMQTKFKGHNNLRLLLNTLLLLHTGQICLIFPKVPIVLCFSKSYSKSFTWHQNVLFCKLLQRVLMRIKKSILFHIWINVWTVKSIRRCSIFLLGNVESCFGIANHSNNNKLNCGNMSSKTDSWHWPPYALCMKWKNREW